MHRPVAALLFLAALGVPSAVRAEGAPSLSDSELDRLHRMIKPQPGESRYHEIDWLTSVWDARKKAAAEGKPIFIWAGSGGGPVGVC